METTHTPHFFDSQDTGEHDDVPDIADFAQSKPVFSVYRALGIPPPCIGSLKDTNALNVSDVLTLQRSQTSSVANAARANFTAEWQVNSLCSR